MSEPCDFRAQLQAASQAAGNRSSVYLVLSGTSAAKPVQHFYATDALTPVPLFQGTQYAGWHEVMPFLVQVTDASGFLDWIDETDSADWGWGLVSDASLKEAFEHIRSLTKILLPDGKDVFFRYWDARYLGAILSGVDEACRAKLMGPAQSIVLPNGEVISHPGTPDQSTPAPEFPWFSLPAETLEKIAVLCWGRLVDNTISRTWQEEALPLLQYPQPIARQKVERHLRRLTSGEVVTELSPEHVQTIHHALLREASPGRTLIEDESMIESRTALQASEQTSDALPDINAITRELRESLTATYDEWRDGWFSSVFMGHEQVLEVNGEGNREDVSEDEVVSSTVAPCEETRKIKVAHFHENVRKTPIPSTRFEIQENTGWIFDSWDTIHSGTTDENGLAEVPVTPGKEYRVVMSPDISQADMDALYDTYDGFVEQCCALLENTWNNGARQEWESYLSMNSTEQSLAVYGRLQEGIADGFTGVLDDIRRIYDVICGLLDYDFSNLPEDLQEQMETLKKADDAYLKACLVANDEIFLFLVMYTVRQYFKLLSPTQVAEVSGELVGQILFDVVVGLIITGGAGLAAKYGARIGSKAAAGAMNVADSARISKNILGEFLGQFAKEFQDFMEDIGTNHRAIQVAGGSRLNPSTTQRGPEVRNRNAMYQQIADDDEVVNLQSGGRDHAAASETSNAPVRDEPSPSETDQGRVTQDNESTENVADPISTVTGEEVLELTDARLSGPLPFEFKRVYRSGSSDRRLDMGYGWRHSLNHSLSFDGSSVTWHDHEGKNTRLPELDSAPFGTNSQTGMAAWKEGEQIVVCAGEKAPRYHFRREGDRGVLVQISDRYGNKLQVGYDLHGQLERVTSESGDALAFEFDDPYLKAVTRLRRKLTDTGYQWQTLRTERRYEYSACDDLIAAEDAVDGIERYGYDNHMLTSRQLAGGYSFYLEWDETSPKGRCVHQWGDSAQVDTRFEWDDDNHTCTVSYVDGSKEIWRYDGAAQLQEKIDPDGAKHVSEYDEKGRLKATVDPMGARTEYQYDSNGRLQGKTGRDGQPILFTYRKGRIAEIHRNGQTWAFDYTRHGDLSRETDPKGRVTRYSYNSQGQLTQVHLPDGRTHKWGWNSHGQLIEETTPTGAFYQYRYDEFGQLLAKKDARGAITRYQCDGLGRVTDEILSGNRRRQYHYNHYNKVTRFIDEKGRETRYEYGSNLHLLTRRINPDGSELRYRYDHHRFLLTHIENERGEEYRIDYYPSGLVKQETAFDGHRTAYQYDLNGHLIEKAEYGTASDVLQTTAYERDELGRLLKKVLPDGREIQYGYNADGKLTAVDDGHWPLAFEYDEFGLLKTEHQGWATLQYRYDEMDRLSGMVLPDGQALAYQHDKSGLLSGIDLNGQPLTRHRMAATGEEIERQQGDLLSAYVYDEEGRLTQHRVHQGRIKDIAAQRDYQYDPNGNLKAIQDSRKGLREYVYDPMDRLVGVRGDLYEQLIHDPAGNLLEQSQSPARGNTANVRGNRLTMHGDCHYEYDDFGNLTEERRGKDQKLVTRYSYDCEHRLTSVTKPDGSTWHYEYDAFGRRIAKTNGLTRTEFLWQGDRLIAEETGDQYRTYIYEPDTFKPLALVDGCGPEQASIYYYHLDHLGTPQELTNAQGDLVWSVTYRAYGNVVRALANEIDNPIRFQGQYHDPETGLHYNRHRYYNPNTGRFLTPDPIGLAGGLNNYQYVPNPTGWVDPLGLSSVKGDCPGAGGDYSTIVPGGGLMSHERAGGHLLERHVGHSEQQLLSRIEQNKRISGASSFLDRPTAERAVSQALEANNRGVERFLSGDERRLVINHSLEQSVGISVKRGNTTVDTASNVRVVLERDPKMSIGYRIVTGFPTL